MTTQMWIIYLSVVIAATATPGPAVFFIVTQSALHGWKKAVYSALGNICGLLFTGITAVIGLGAILETSETVFNIVKFTGATYLIYIGVKMLIRRDVGSTILEKQNSSRRFSPGKIFFQAFGVAAGNPKAIVFLTALLPQFINLHEPIMVQFALLISTLMSFSFLFLMFYAILASKAKAWLDKPNRINGFHRIGGSSFIGFGILLATSTNK